MRYTLFVVLACLLKIKKIYITIMKYFQIVLTFFITRINSGELQHLKVQEKCHDEDIIDIDTL